MLSFTTKPNEKIERTDAFVAANTYYVMASDGALYTTLAALLAAGKVPFPGLDPMMNMGELTLHSENSGANGSPFFFRVNTATAPTSDNAVHEAGGGQQYGIEGTITNLWLAVTDGTDKVIASLRY